MFNVGTDAITAKQSYRNFYFNEFVANGLHDNIGWIKKIASNLRKNEAVFSFKYQKFSVRVNHKIKHKGTKKIILISVLYQNASTSRILGPAGLDF